MKPETWIIVHKETGEQWFGGSGKSTWKTKGAAKTSWATSGSWVDREDCRFDDQDTYILKEISASRIYELENIIQKMEAMIKSEDWKRLKEFVCAT